jgi:hypothetical protein
VVIDLLVKYQGRALYASSDGVDMRCVGEGDLVQLGMTGRVVDLVRLVLRERKTG